jgi:hypothetical protein
MHPVMIKKQSLGNQVGLQKLRFTIPWRINLRLPFGGGGALQ